MQKSNEKTIILDIVKIAILSRNKGQSLMNI